MSDADDHLITAFGPLGEIVLIAFRSLESSSRPKLARSAIDTGVEYSNQSPSSELASDGQRLMAALADGGPDPAAIAILTLALAARVAADTQSVDEMVGTLMAYAIDASHSVAEAHEGGEVRS